MKLFEDMREMGDSIHEIIKKIVNDVYEEEVDDDVVEKIVNNLSLSDLLALDSAYTENNQEEIRNIIGPIPTLEYKMTQGRDPESDASNRPIKDREHKTDSGGAESDEKSSGETDDTGPKPQRYSTGSQNKTKQTNESAVVVDFLAELQKRAGV